MSRKIRLGILGGGGDSLVGILHRIAASMHNKYEIVGGVFNPNFDENLKFAKEIGLNENRIYEDFEKMIEEELKLEPKKKDGGYFNSYSKFSPLSNGKEIT